MSKRQRQHGHSIPAACKSGKRAYVDRQRAVQAARKSQQIRGARLRVYKCTYVHLPIGTVPGCGQYHLATVRESAA